MPREQTTIDVNCDLGESFGAWSFGDDADLLPFVSSVNVACGFHAGDPRAMRLSCELASAAGVNIGAHPGYRDLAGFGRRAIEVDSLTVRDETTYQVGALVAIAHGVGARVGHVKPHGALYHAVASEEAAAEAFVEGVRAVGQELEIVGPAGSALERAAAAADLRFVREGFADRAYDPAGGLVPRGEPGATLGPDAAAAQALHLATHAAVSGINTICIHGDTAVALETARAVHGTLIGAGIEIGRWSHAA